MNADLSKMVELTDAELDAVAAGLITVVAADLVDVNDVNVNVPIAANAAIAVLGGAGAAGAGNLINNLGRQR